MINLNTVLTLLLIIKEPDVTERIADRSRTPRVLSIEGYGTLSTELLTKYHINGYNNKTTDRSCVCIL